MAEEKKEIIIDVKINAEDVMERLGAVSKEIDALKYRNMDLRQEMELDGKLYKTNAAYIAENEAKIKSLSAAQKSLEGQYQIITKAGHSFGSSIIEQKEALKNLQLQYTSLTEEQKKSVGGQEMKKSLIELNNQINELDPSFNKFGESTKSLRAELINLTNEMVRMAEEGLKDSEQYEELSARAGELKQDINLIQAEIKGLASTSPMLDGLIGSAQALVGAFGAYKSTMVLLGIENQNFEKTMKQMQGILTLLVSLQTIHNTVIKNYNLQVFAKNALDKIGINQTIAAAKAEAAKTAMMTSGSIATKAAAAATWLWNAALSANPVVLVLTAIAALVVGISAFVGKTKEASDETARFNRELDLQYSVLGKQKEKQKEITDILQHQINLMKAQGASADSVAEAEAKLMSQRILDARKNYELNKKYVDSLEMNKQILEDRKNEEAKLIDQIANESGKRKKILEKELKNVQDVIKKTELNIKIGIEVESDNEKIQREAQIAAANEKKRQEDAAKAAKAASEKRAADALKIQQQLQDELLKMNYEKTQLEIAQETIATERKTKELQKNFEEQWKGIKNNDSKKIKAQEDLAQLIETIEKNSAKKIQDIKDNATEESIKKQIDEEQKRISLLLEVATKGSDAELALRTQQIELLRKEELRQAEITNAEKLKLGEENLIDLQAINEKYDYQLNEAKKQNIIKREKEISQTIKNEFDNRVLMAGENEEIVSEIELIGAHKRYNYLKNLDKETKEALFESNAEYTAALIESRNRIIVAEKAVMTAQINTIKSVGTAISSVSDAIASVMSTMAEDSYEYAVFQKLLAIAKIAQAVASAVALAIEAAAPGDPYTVAVRIAAAAAAAIAATATLVSTVKQITIPNPPKFAGGGIVPGNSTSGDKVPALLNSREMVLNMQQQSKLFDWVSSGNVNAGIDYDLLAEKIATANESLPPPVMDYREFTDFQRRLQIIEQKTRIA